VEEEITMFNIVVATVRPSSLSRELAARNVLSASSRGFYCHSSRQERDHPGNDPVSVLLGIRNNEALQPYILSAPVICK
jgi:hypothetical protein